MLKYLIICPLVFLAGFVDSIAGGGGLISLPAYMLAGLPAHNAIATNKMSSTLGTTAATFRYGKRGMIPWKMALTAAAFSLAGSQIGARLALLLSDKILKMIMLPVLPLVAMVALRKKTLAGGKTPRSKGATAAIVLSSSLLIGVYDGIYGPGTGTFLILAFTALAHIELSEANGMTKVVNLASNLSALAVFLANGKTIVLLGLTAGLFSIAGNALGAGLFTRRSTTVTKPILLGVLGIFFIKILWELFTGV